MTTTTRTRRKRPPLRVTPEDAKEAEVFRTLSRMTDNRQSIGGVPSPIVFWALKRVWLRAGGSMEVVS